MAKKSLILGYGVSGHGAEALLKFQKKAYDIWDDDPKRLINNPDMEDLHSKIFDEVIVSPGIPPNHPVLMKAQKENVPIFTELELGLKFYSCPIIAVTGTNGKSTTTAMIAHGLRELGHSVIMAGNIGTPLAEHAAKQEKADYIVLELSSYQLHYLCKIPIYCAIFTNFSADHEAWHGSQSEYFKAKAKIFDFVEKKGAAIVGKSVLETAQLQTFSLPPYLLIQIPPSDKNADFARQALMYLTHCSPVEAKNALSNFKGLPHRLEWIGTIKSQPVWNDSKATNFDSTLYAIRNVSQRPFLLLLGGRLKNDDFSQLTNMTPQLKKSISHIYAFGESHKKLQEALSNHFPIDVFPTLGELLESLLPSLRQSPQPILFSPGGSSFDEFRNFADRGDFFRAKITSFLDSE